MPGYLSNGSRQYNQVRRVHPRDSVAQLGYYLPASSAGSLSVSSSSYASSQSALKANIGDSNNIDRKSPGHSEASSSSASSYYGSTLTRLLARGRAAIRPAKRWSRTEDVLQSSKAHRRKTKAQIQDICPYNSSRPEDSSGFGEGTLVHEQTVQGRHISESQLVNLKESNYIKSSRVKLDPSSYMLYSRDLESARSSQHVKRWSMVGSNNKIATGNMRLKRRNISRMNRRMLINGDEHLINQYAFSELFSQSEIPGFREIFASDSYLRKFCWIVAFLFMTVLSLNDMTELITEYYEYPITVDLRLRDSARLPFPSVTVCNLNVVRFSALCSSSASSRFDLTSQIPTELREKLCGILVEKKNTTDADMSDINNIGIKTTTSTTSTFIATSSTTSAPSVTGTPAPMATPSSRTTNTIPADKQPNQDISMSDSVSKLTTPMQITIKPVPEGSHFSVVAEHKITPTPAISDQATTTQRRGTAKGALDLGDFVDPALLVLEHERVFTSLNRSHKARRKMRSIKLSEFESSARPFASIRSRLRVPLTGSRRKPSQANQLTQESQQAPGQHPNKLGVNIQNNRGSNVPTNAGQPPVHVIRNGGFVVPPNSVTQNSHQNPLLNNLASGPSPASTTGQPASTPFMVPPALPDDFELSEREERELQENLTNWLAVMHGRDPELTWSLGHQFNDMVLRCTMKSINCTHQRSFENSFTPTEGNCFTFRSKVKRRAGGPTSSTKGSSMFEEANLAGTNHGLELVLNLEKNEYISGSSQVGALVMIHHPSDLGYAASEATFVTPEFTTYIGLKMVNITRLPAPYPEYCVDSWPAKFADTLTRNSTYSQQACLKICLQKTIQSHCQCQSAILPVVELDLAPNTAKSSNLAPANNASDSKSPSSDQRIIICDTRKVYTRQCVREVMLRAADRVHNCECPPKCQVVRYDKTVSMARWPTREDKITFDRGKMDVNFQNLAKVIVYFQTMTCDEVTQQAVFNAAKLFSALGGIMGMYVGFSFLSVFEIFEVMSRKMWHHFRFKFTHCMNYRHAKA